MTLLAQTDRQLQAFATPIVNRLIEAAGTKDWEAFSCRFVAEGQSPEAKANVENQWETNPVLCSFKPEPEFLSVLRRSDHVVTLWKMQSDMTSDEILGLLAFIEIEGEVKVYGFRIS